MVKIEIDGHPLVLYPSQKIRFKMRNPLMYEDVLPKYYSFPFTIPLEIGKNSFLLNYPQLWKNNKRLSGSIDCMVYLFGQNNPRRSVLNINAATEDSAECNITLDKNVDDVGDKNLRELDMGTYLLGDNVAKVVKLRVATEEPYIPGVGTVDLSINGTMVQTTRGSILMPTADTFYNAIRNNINTADCGVIATVENYGDVANICLVLTANNTGSDNFFTLDNLEEVLAYFGENAGYYWRVFEEEAWIHDHLQDIRDGVYNIATTYNPDNHPVVFPLIENVAYIEDDYYNGFQNSQFVESSFDKNNIRFLTPMPHLCYVMKKVFTALGFDAYGSFLEDDSIKRIILYSNVASDYWNKIYGNAILTTGFFLDVYDFNKIVNIHRSTVTIAEHCPDITVKEFLTEIRKLFNLKFNYDYPGGKVEIVISQTQMESSIQQAPDYTENIVNKWQLQNSANKLETVKLFKFEEDSSDGKPKQLGLLDYQQPLIIDPAATKEITPKVSSICEEKADNFIEMAALQLSGYYNGQGSVTKLKLLQYFNLPEASINALTIPDWAKIWFSGGDEIGPFAMNKDTYTHFSYVSTWSLRWDTDKGFYKQCWEKQTALLNNGVQLKIAMTFSNTELADMEKTPFHNLDGSIVIWKDIEVQLSENDNMQAECIYQLV